MRQPGLLDLGVAGRQRLERPGQGPVDRVGEPALPDPHEQVAFVDVAGGGHLPCAARDVRHEQQGADGIRQ